MALTDGSPGHGGVSGDLGLDTDRDSLGPDEWGIVLGTKTRDVGSDVGGLAWGLGQPLGPSPSRDTGPASLQVWEPHP